MTKPTHYCFECGGPMRLVREKAEMRMGSRTGVVEVERFRCNSCGEIFVSPDQMDSAQRALVSKLRSEEGLLGPDRIRQIRLQKGFTQTEFERLLGVGPKTVIRWERGTVFQNRATDELLRLIEAVPAAYDFLAGRHGLLAPAFVDVQEPKTQEYRARFESIGQGPRSTDRETSGPDFKKQPANTKTFVPGRETTVPTIPEKELT